MKNSWPHILNLIFIVIIVLMFIGVFDFQKPINLSDQLLGVIKERNAVAAVAYDRNGGVTVLNEKGEEAKKCSIGPNGKYPQCHGLGRDGEVLDLTSITTLKVKGSSCYIWYDYQNVANEICW